MRRNAQAVAPLFSGRLRRAGVVLGTAMFLAFAIPAGAQEVVRVTWPSTHAAKPPVLSKPAARLLPFFRLALPLLPESTIVSMSLSQPAVVGLPAADCTRLRALSADRYQIIAKDPVFHKVPSALPYCFAEKQPDHGFALVYRPAVLDANTPCLIFLHGYGGSYLWCQQLLAESFPRHLIICPAYGIASDHEPAAYLAECLAAVANQLGRPLPKPTLIGLSAGGLGAARIFTAAPDQFQQLIVIAAYPPPETLAQFHPPMIAHFVAGAHEPYVQSGLFQRSMDFLRPHTQRLDAEILPDADHYFLLEKREQTIRLLQRWIP